VATQRGHDHAEAIGIDPVPNHTRDVQEGIARWDAYVCVPDPDACLAIQRRRRPFSSAARAHLRADGFPAERLQPCVANRYPRLSDKGPRAAL